jgi:uncharacterized protein DUF1800
VVGAGCHFLEVGDEPLIRDIADLGEPLYGKIEPTGYPDSSEAWLSTVSVLGRINFAITLSAGQIPDVKINGVGLDGKNAAAIARELCCSCASHPKISSIGILNAIKQNAGCTDGGEMAERRATSKRWVGSFGKWPDSDRRSPLLSRWPTRFPKADCERG